MTLTTHPFLDHGLSILHARLQDQAQAGRAGQEAGAHPFVTISREAGAGATTLGRLLVPRLNERLREPDGHSWVFLDKDLLTHALTRHHLPERLAEYLPEDRVSEIKGVIGELVGLHPSLWQLEHQVAEAILQLAHVGHVIFAGRASHLITRPLPGGFHVRLVASMPARIQRMLALLNCDARAAAAHIDKSDLARRRYVRTNFDEDIDDPHTYDLVINTDHLSPGCTARIVVDALCDRISRFSDVGAGSTVTEA